VQTFTQICFLYLLLVLNAMLLHVSVAAAMVDIFHMGFLLAADNVSDSIHI